MIITSDAEDSVHIHGYDVMFDLIPNKPAKARFTADIPGIFEVELEQSAKPLFNLTVKQP